MAVEADTWYRPLATMLVVETIAVVAAAILITVDGGATSSETMAIVTEP